MTLSNEFCNAKWIWRAGITGENDYAEFSDSIKYSGGEAILRISICGDYTLYVNGKFVECNQYADFEHYKVYDEIDITPYLKNGDNRISILGWYFGVSGMRYNTPVPGLIYEVVTDGDTVAVSSSNTLSRQSRAYTSGEFRKISKQLGYSFAYDACVKDRWLEGELDEFSSSVVCDRKLVMYKRPCSKLRHGDAVYGEITRTESSYIVDLGREYVGLPYINFSSDCVQDVTVCYGEVLVDGHTKRKIGNRDFSFDYRSVKGNNEYVNYMFRMACRYIEIYSEKPVDIKKIGIISQYYPTVARDIDLPDTLDRKIYDMCVNTLNLCMMEHYVDCPWREQCFYTFDSRNQMLSGYWTYEGGNFEYARANLLLISKDNRNDGLLSICFPSADDLVIPSFSLYYILAVKEYIDYSGDLSLGKEIFGKLESIMSVFEGNIKDGLVHKFEGTNIWNFYDWSDYAYYQLYHENKGSDFLMNAIFVIALRSYADICLKIGKTNRFEGLAERISSVANDRFFDKTKGLYFIENSDEVPTELANSLAIVSGLATGDVAKGICKVLSGDGLVECSLSMKTFKYDALLSVDMGYKDAVFAEIRNTYKKMLDAGSTTVWETIDGADAFDNAGSLCHGWSAIPVYYYNKFKK